MKSSRASPRAPAKPVRKPAAARRAAAVRLRESEARLRLALDAAQIGTFDWDIPRDRITWTRWLEQLWGIKPGEFRGTYQDFAERVHPEDLPRVTAELARCRAARGRFSSEFRVVSPDGTERWVLGSGEFSFARDGSAVRMRGIVKDISDRKRLESNLIASHKRYRTLIENSHDAILLFGADGTVLFSGPSTTGILGYAREELQGRNALEFVRPDCQDAVREWIGDARRNPGVAVPASAYVRHKSGDWRFLEGHLTNLLHEPAVGAIVNHFRDVTERRQMDQRLRESEEKLSKAFHASPAMVVITTLDGKNVDFNDAYMAFIGRPREELLGKSVIDMRIIDADERQKLIDLIDRGGGTVRNAEVAVRTSMGARQFLLSLDTITLSGAPHRLATILDITERKQREEALRESTERLGFMIRGTETGLWDWDLATNQVHYSREWKQLLGYQDHEIANHLDEWRRLTHPEDVEPTLSKVQAFLLQPVGTLEAEFRMRHADGEYRWILSRATVQLGTDGTPARLLGLHFDITDRKRQSEALRLSHAQLLSFVEQAPVLVAMFDREMRYLNCSRRWAVDYGRSLEDLIGRSHYDVYPDIPDSWKDVHRRGLAGETIRNDDDLWIRADGTKHWLRWAVLPWRDTRGEIGGIITVVEDITDQKRAEEELRNLSRRLMESQDTSRRELARELHDRIGQNLTALSLNLSIIQAQIPAQPPAVIPSRLEDSLNLVAATMDRVRNLLADLRPPALDDYGLAAALRWYAKLFSERAGVAVRVVAREPPLRLPPRVETALFRVAEEALTNVGRHAAAHEVLITLAEETGGEVRLTIADDGQGFDPASLIGSASWGMASMRERAEAIGAHCDIESVPGRGTTVTVRIPRT